MSLEAMTEEAQRLASYRMELAAHLAQLRRRRQDVDREVMPMIRHFAQLAADSKTKLIAAVGAESQLFEKPRSQSVSGVRFGMVKQKGKVVIENEPVTIKRIKNLLPEEQAELLINTKESVHKPSVADLTAADLKRLGIAIEDDEEVAFVKTVDNEIDKLVDALLSNDDIEDAS